MNAAELKLKIFREVDSLDKSKLEDIYGLIHNRINQDQDIDEWHLLSEEQRRGLLDAIGELELGKGIPHEKIMAKYRKKYAN